MQTNTSKPKNFRKVEGDIYARGKRGMLYVYRRIPAAIKLAYPPKKSHITLGLKTACLATARRSARLKVAQIQAEFEQKKAEIDLGRAAEAPVRVGRLTNRQLQGALDHWARDVLLADDARRVKGLSEAEFMTLEKDLQVRLAVYRRALAMGQVLPHLETFTSYLARCGISYQGEDGEEARHVANQFVARLVKVHDHMLSRLSGEVCLTDELVPQVPHPMYLIAPERAPRSSNVATWDSVFTSWRDAVVGRPKPTTVANMTAWRDLQGFAEVNGIVSPADVTPEMMSAFVDDMAARIAPTTTKGRLKMVRKIYAVACSKFVVRENPAVHTIAPEQHSAAKRQKKRLPFTGDELCAVFGSQVYREHRRSPGQAQEATYWIPLIMYYTGARPEEVAGLALADIRHNEVLGWYFDVIDRFDDVDVDLFDDDPVPRSHRRTLKNGASTRRLPVAKELIDLGLVRYVEYVRASGETVLFPSLRKDGVGKLSGAFVKVFSRIKIQELGIADKRKVLYSLRHTMKDLLEQAEVPSKALKRILGHTSGDGDTTDGYGSDLPFEQIVRHFGRVKFPPIPALPWEPGRGGLRLPKKAKAACAEAVVARPGGRQAGVTRSRGTLGKRLH